MVLLISANKIVLWILVSHIVEVVVVSEKGVNWVPNVSRSYEP